MQNNLPPYGKKLYHFLLSGQRPKNDIYILMGTRCWEAADAHNLNKFAIYLPPNKNPVEYAWPVFECDIVIFDGGRSSQEFIELFAAVLFSYGANIIRYVSHENKVTVFKKEF